MSCADTTSFLEMWDVPNGVMTRSQEKKKKKRLL